MRTVLSCLLVLFFCQLVFVQATAIADAPMAPVNTELPRITGTAQVGSALTASTGTWSGTQPISYTIRWQRCDAAGENCTFSSIWVGDTYTPTEVDVGSTLRVRVVASNSSGSGAARSEPTAIVLAIAGGSWTNVINDRFDSGGIPAHWKLYQFRYATSDNCATPSHNWVAGGYLRILMRYETSGWCGPGWYTGGMAIAGVAPFVSIDQRITIRFRVVYGGVIAHRVIPMRWPVSAPQPEGGEEDYCESHDLAFCSSFFHYDAGRINYAHYFDLQQWHTLRFERRNFVIRTYVDDMSKPDWTYYGSSITLPATLKRAVLQQECQPLRVGGCPSGTTGTEEIQIDWIMIDNPS